MATALTMASNPLRALAADCHEFSELEFGGG